MGIDWKAKLTSRKFWMAVVGLVTGLLLLFGVDKNQTEQVGGIVLAAGSVIAYILGEGMTDAAAAGYEDVPEEENKPPESIETGGDL